jgi:UPF0716 family protein affecting phage T7 exclusion
VGSKRVIVGSFLGSFVACTVVIVSRSTGALLGSFVGVELIGQVQDQRDEGFRV